MDEVAGIERLASFIAAHVKMGFPKTALSYNEDAAVREIAKRLGTPAVCLFSAEEVKAKVKQMDQMQAQAAAAEVARAQGEAIQQNATAMQSIQSTPASPVPLLTPEAAGGLM